MSGLEHVVTTPASSLDTTSFPSDFAMAQSRVLYEAPSQMSIMIFDDVRNVPNTDGHIPARGYLPSQGPNVPMMMGNYNITRRRDEQDVAFERAEKERLEEIEKAKRMDRDPAYRRKVEEEEKRREEKFADICGRQYDRL